MKLFRLCAFVLAAGLAAQTGVEKPAQIEGFVTTDVAAVLPGVTIGVDSLTKGFHREAVTTTSGHYVVEELPAGAYSIYAEAPGYGCILYPHVALMPGEHLRQDFSFTSIKRNPNSCEPPKKKPKGE